MRRFARHVQWRRRPVEPRRAIVGNGRVHFDSARRGDERTSAVIRMAEDDGSAGEGDRNESDSRPGCHEDASEGTGARIRCEPGPPSELIHEPWPGRILCSTADNILYPVDDAPCLARAP